MDIIMFWGKQINISNVTSNNFYGADVAIGEAKSKQDDMREALFNDKQYSQKASIRLWISTKIYNAR